MSGHARSKVNLHLANCHALAQAVGAIGVNAVTSSLCLQIEMALGFYVREILQVAGRKGIQPWPLTAESLAALAHQFDSADLNELNEISQEKDSWIYSVLRRLEILRQADSVRAIKAEIFQSDLDAPGLLIASSAGQREPSFDLAHIMADLDSFEALVRRQRLGHEEY
jgi:hypothetical protein